MVHELRTMARWPMGQLAAPGRPECCAKCLASLPKACNADRVQGNARHPKYVEGNNPYDGTPELMARLRRNGAIGRGIESWRLAGDNAGTSWCIPWQHSEQPPKGRDAPRWRQIRRRRLVRFSSASDGTMAKAPARRAGRRPGFNLEQIHCALARLGAKQIARIGGVAHLS